MLISQLPRHQGCSFENGAKNWAGEERVGGLGIRGRRSSHGFELVNSLLGVSLPDLAQRLVLVAAGLDVLCVQHVVLRLLRVVPSLCQLGAQGLCGSGQRCVNK